jgi:predicted PurR-regulated permease PerM
MSHSVASDARLRFLLGAAAVVVIAGGLRSAAGVIDPLLMAGVVVACAAPLQEQLRRRGLTKGWAMAITSVSVVVALLAFVALVGYAAKALVDTVPRYQERLTVLINSGTTYLDGYGIEMSKSRVLAMINPSKLIALATELAQGLGGALSEALLIVMLSIFLLIESNAFWRRRSTLRRSDEIPSVWHQRFDAIANDVQQYVNITLLTGVLYAVGVWLVMIALGTDLPVLWAVVALVLSFVPGIGFVLSMIPPVALTLLEFGVPRALVLMAIFVVWNNVVDNVIKPRFMKDGFDMGPFVMFVSLLVWAFLLGPTGALLAVPLTAATRRLVFPADAAAGGAVSDAT